MEKITKTSLRDQIVLSLKNSILTGEFKHGDILLQEELAQNLGVSRMPIREALLILERDHFITFTESNKAVVLSFSSDDIYEHYELRAILESHCARHAAQNVDADTTTLELLNEKMKQTQDYSEFFKLNKLFHSEIHRLSKLKKTVYFVENLWHNFPPVFIKSNLQFMKSSILEHDDIISPFQLAILRRLKNL